MQPRNSYPDPPPLTGNKLKTFELLEKRFEELIEADEEQESYRVDWQLFAEPAENGGTQAGSIPEIVRDRFVHRARTLGWQAEVGETEIVLTRPSDRGQQWDVMQVLLPKSDGVGHPIPPGWEPFAATKTHVIVRRIAPKDATERLWSDREQNDDAYFAAD